VRYKTASFDVKELRSGLPQIYPAGEAHAYDPEINSTLCGAWGPRGLNIFEIDFESASDLASRCPRCLSAIRESPP
jgi:hypothetical protein